MEFVSVKKWKPIVKSWTRFSRDGQWVIVKTLVTDVRPVGYYRDLVLGANVTANPGCMEPDESADWCY